MLYPDYYCESVFMIPYNELLEKKIKYLIFDLDNTLAPYNVARPPAKISALFKRLRRMGFTLCVMTNNTEKRTRIFNEHLGVVSLHGAFKPLATGINRAMKQLGAAREETAIIGDQIFTDVWCGKNAKITTVLVKPINSKEDFPHVRFKRVFEKWVLKAYLKKQAQQS